MLLIPQGGDYQGSCLYRKHFDPPDVRPKVRVGIRVREMIRLWRLWEMVRIRVNIRIREIRLQLGLN